MSKLPELPAMPVTAPVEPPLVEVPAVPESTLTLADAFPARRERPRAFYIVSQWHIEPAEGTDRIAATNNTTGDKYEGTIADFNDMMKGL
jgi:hypothetical protein